MKKCLLIIADDWEALEVYETKLESYFTIFTAPFGDVGIQAAREQRPDRILIDLVFEDMHAEEACELLRATGNACDPDYGGFK